MMKNFLSLTCLAALLVLASCKEDTPAETLYSRMGGLDAIGQVVDDFLVNVAADTTINGFFTATIANPYRIQNLRNHLVDQICEATGGPCVYKGKTMANAHQGMNITDAQMDALLADLVAALDINGVDPDDKNELLGILGMLRPDIVGH